MVLIGFRLYDGMVQFNRALCFLSSQCAEWLWDPASYLYSATKWCL